VDVINVNCAVKRKIHALALVAKFGDAPVSPGTATAPGRILVFDPK